MDKCPPFSDPLTFRVVYLPPTNFHYTRLLASLPFTLFYIIACRLEWRQYTHRFEILIALLK
jgi:hypothetical protein